MHKDNQHNWVICDTQHRGHSAQCILCHNAECLNYLKCYAKCRYAECRYAECRGALASACRDAPLFQFTHQVFKKQKGPKK